MRTVGEIIRAKRKENKMVIKEIAEALGVSPSTVTGWELGRFYPNALNLLGLAEIYGCAIDELCGRSPIENIKKSMWEIIRKEDIIVTNQNIDWLLERAMRDKV